MEVNHKGVHINEAIDKTSYSPSMKAEIVQLLYECFSTKMSKIYLITRLYSQHEETIFLINHHLPISLEGKLPIYISLIIYLPTKFPLAPPEIHLEKKDNNSELKSSYSNSQSLLINNSTLQINYELMMRWNREARNFSQILDMIKKVFERDYPFTYANFPTLCYNGLCVLQPQYLIPIILNENGHSMHHPPPQLLPLTDTKPVNNQGIQDKPLTSIYTSVMPNQSHQRQSSIDYPKANNNQVSSIMNDLIGIKFTNDHADRERIKSILKKEIEWSLKGIVTKQRSELFSQRSALEGLLAKLKQRKSSEHQLSFDTATLESSLEWLSRKYAKCQTDLQSELNANKEILSRFNSFDQINSIITLENRHSSKQALKYSLMELTIEEFLLTMRKTIQRNVLPFNEVVRQHRLLARDLFYIHYLRSKP